MAAFPRFLIFQQYSIIFILVNQILTENAYGEDFCRLPPSVTSTRLQYTVGEILQNFNVNCGKNLIALKPYETKPQCLSNGTWSKDFPSCVENSAYQKYVKILPDDNENHNVIVDNEIATYYGVLGADANHSILIDLGQEYHVSIVYFVISPATPFTLEIEVENQDMSSKTFCNNRTISENIKVETHITLKCNSDVTLGRFVNIFPKNIMTEENITRYIVIHEVAVITKNITRNVSCGPPKIPLNGIVKILGNVAKYFCNSGFTLKGHENVTCESGEWQEPEPSCIESPTTISGIFIAHNTISTTKVPPALVTSITQDDPEPKSTSLAGIAIMATAIVLVVISIVALILAIIFIMKRRRSKNDLNKLKVLSESLDDDIKTPNVLNDSYDDVYTEKAVDPSVNRSFGSTSPVLIRRSLDLYYFRPPPHNIHYDFTSPDMSWGVISEYPTLPLRSNSSMSTVYPALTQQSMV